MPANLLDGLPGFQQPPQPEKQEQAAAPPNLRSIGDIPATRTAIYNNVANAFRNIPVASNNRFSLAVTDVDYEGPESYGLRESKQAILEGRTLGRRVRGNFVLRDAAGNVIDQRRVTLGTVPTLLDSGAYIINGNKYGLLHQARLRPGVFARRTAAGELSAHVNVAGGFGHQYELEPESGVFRVVSDQARIPAFPLLKALGVSDDAMRAAWGDEVYAANAKTNSHQALDKLYEKIRGQRKPTPGEDKAAIIRAAFDKLELDPEVTSHTLGKPYEKLTPDAVLDSMTKLLKIQRGEAEEDDRDAMPFQRIMGPEDLFADRIKRAKGLLSSLLWKATFTGNLQKLPAAPADKLLRGTLLDSGLGAVLQEIGPPEVLDYSYRVSRMGEGGIPSSDSVPETARDLMPSYAGYIDPGLSPESDRIGVDNRLAINTKKDDQGRLYAEFTNAQTGQHEWHSPQEIADKTVSFPGELASGEEYVAATKSGRHVYVPRDKVDFELSYPEDMYSPLSNLIPLKMAGEAKRVSMGGRMIAQSLPLVKGEAPFVRSGMPDGQRSYEEEYGERMAARKSPIGGIVTAVSPGMITVTGHDGKPRQVELYENHPNNMKTFRHNTPVVQVGQEVGQGQLLAKSNYTDDKGVTALGLNARVAYLPWRGINTNDAIVVSESFAKRATSEQM
jgi:DNA-directed RNA polymerase subunit beta